MYFLLIGVLGLILKFLEIGPVAAMSWWLVLSPFALAVVWWAWADASGYTKRKAMEKEDAKKVARIAKAKEAMGQTVRRRR